MADSEKAQNRCPNLGLKRNRARCIPRAVERNYCHRPPSPQPVAISHQSESCLSENHTNCPVFQRVGEWDGPLPPGIQAEQPGGRNAPFFRVVNPQSQFPENTSLEVASRRQKAEPEEPEPTKALTNEKVARVMPDEEEVEEQADKKPKAKSPAAAQSAKAAEKAPRKASGPNPLVAFLFVFTPLVVGVGLIVFAVFGGFDALGSPPQSEPATPAPLAIPTTTPLPILSTPTDEAPEEPSPLPSSTEVAASALEPIIETTLRFDSNLRAGPGADYADINFLESSTRITILGRDETSLWLLIRTEEGQTGWLAASQASGDLDTSLIPLVPATVVLTAED
jgi:hypothetical protein